MVADEEVKYIIEKYHLNQNNSNPIEIDDTRLALSELCKEFNFTTGVEIGVEEGIFSELICQTNPSLTLYGIDPWLSYVRGTQTYNQQKLSRHYENAVKRLSKYPNCYIIRKYSMDAVMEFYEGSLDFIYIDGDHSFDFVMTDIIEWSKKVKSGGIVSGHDYKDSTSRLPFHTIIATQAYTKVHKISPWFIFTKDEAPSWMWVKP